MIKKAIKAYNEKGMASIVVVTALIILLGLLSVGFSRFANRDLSASLQDQKARAAYYAAESGINDTIKFLNTPPSGNGQPCGANLQGCDTQCNNPLLTNLNTGNSNAQYQCVLLNPSPQELLYQKMDPGSSKVVLLNSNGQFTSLFFYWTTPDGSTPSYINNAADPLFDTATWNSGNYASMLRVTLYPVPSSKDMSCLALNPSATCVTNGNVTKTFFLYPVTSGGAASNTINYQTAANGSLTPITCGVSSYGSGYDVPSPAGNYCGTIINNLPDQTDSGSYYYARITPLYASANIGIKGTATGTAGNAAFNNVQSVIDVTAKSADTVRRLQARVELSSSPNNPSTVPTEIDNIPEDGVLSAQTVCKRYIVFATQSTQISTTNPGDCAAGGAPPPQQSGTPIAITGTYATGLGSYIFQGTVQPNDTNATYYFNYGKVVPQFSCKNGVCTTTYQFFGTPSTGPVAPPGQAIDTSVKGINAKYSESLTVSSSKFSTGTYGYQICALNTSSKGTPSCGNLVHFTVGGGGSSSSSSSSSSSGSGSSSSSSSTGGGNPPPPGNCSTPSISQTQGPPSAAFSASSSCPGSGITVHWHNDWNTCGGDVSGSSDSSSDTTQDYAGTNPYGGGTITFNVWSTDSYGQSSAHVSNSHDVPAAAGGVTCP